MRKLLRHLLRHLACTPIWIALLMMGWEIVWRNLPVPGGYWVVYPTPELRLAMLRDLEELRRASIAYNSLSMSDYVWIFTPLAIVVVIWAVVRILHRKRPNSDCKGGFIA